MKISILTPDYHYYLDHVKIWRHDKKLSGKILRCFLSLFLDIKKNLSLKNQYEYNFTQNLNEKCPECSEQ